MTESDAGSCEHPERAEMVYFDPSDPAPKMMVVCRVCHRVVFMGRRSDYQRPPPPSSDP